MGEIATVQPGPNGELEIVFTAATLTREACTSEAFASRLFRWLYTTQGTLQPYQASEVRQLRGQAMAYVWGWQDAGGAPKDSHEAWCFSVAYGVHAARYALGQISYRRPISSAFGSWRDGGAIERN